jgi:hypothetical protein
VLACLDVAVVDACFDVVVGRVAFAVSTLPYSPHIGRSEAVLNEISVEANLLSTSVKMKLAIDRMSAVERHPSTQRADLATETTPFTLVSTKQQFS